MLALAGVVLAGVSCVAAPWYAAPIVWPFLALGVLGLVLRFLAPRMPRRTPAGAIEAARWRAYARALQRQPVEHLRLPSPRAAASNGAPAGTGAAPAGAGTDTGPEGGAGAETEVLAQREAVFERALPYAVALGQGKQWVERFAQAGTPAPRWLGPPVVVYPGPTWGGPSSRRYGRRGGWYPGYPGYPGTPAIRASPDRGRSGVSGTAHPATAEAEAEAARKTGARAPPAAWSGRAGAWPT